MKGTVIIRHKRIKLNNPILVVGLPGVGSVGKIIAEHLRKEYKPIKMATLYSEHFPPQVIMQSNGCLRAFSNRFYLIRTSRNKGNDVVLLTGDSQAATPDGQYMINGMILDYFKKELGGKFIYTLGGYNIAEAAGKAPRVFGNATSKQVIEQFKDSGVVFGKSKGYIFGAAGLLIAFAKRERINGICLMGETAYIDFDAPAAKAVMEVITKRLGLTVKTPDLDKIIKETGKILQHQPQDQVIDQFNVPQEVPQSVKGNPTYIR
ncbi:MAG: proteasome assembly chaperone family protein [Candidatus Micrarchaeota archaeon]|nr:proteasome assembly chaperone family protein [Candidatus Micrarchaeota archaeon]